MVKFKRTFARSGHLQQQPKPKPRWKKKIAVIEARILAHLIIIACLLLGKLLIATATTTTTTANHNTEATSPTDAVIRDFSVGYNEDVNRHEKELQLLQVAELMNQSLNQLSSMKDNNYTQRPSSNSNSESSVTEQSVAELDGTGMHDILAYDESISSSNQIKLPLAYKKEDEERDRPNNSYNNSSASLKEISAPNHFSDAIGGAPNTTTMPPRSNSSVSKKRLASSLRPNQRQQQKQKPDSIDVITRDQEKRSDLVKNATETNIPLVVSPLNSTVSSSRDNIVLFDNRPQVGVVGNQPNISGSDSSRPSSTTERPQAPADFTPENLHDHDDESDKLLGQVAAQQWRLKQHQALTATEPSSPKVDSSGWLPTMPEKQPQPQRAANNLAVVHHEDNRNDDQHNGQDWLAMRPPEVELINSSSEGDQASSRRVIMSSSGNKAASSGMSLWENNHHYFGQPKTTTTTTGDFQQSSLWTKHVPATFVAAAGGRLEEHQRLYSELGRQKPAQVWLDDETMATTHQVGGDYTAVNSKHQEPPTFMVPDSGSLVLRQQQQLELQRHQQQANGRQSPFVSALRAKSFGLLPRLAAKLFNGGSSSSSGYSNKQPARIELLNQQQLAFQLATHLNAPLSQQQTDDGQKSHRLSKASSKIFPAKSSLVKSLLARDQLLQQSSAAQALAVPALASVVASARLRKLPTEAVPSSNGAQIDTSSPSAESQLVLVNDQIYSVLRTPSSSALPSSGGGRRGERLVLNGFRGSVFDHKTSDTSEFPVFEAMSMQHVPAAGSGGVQAAPSFLPTSRVSPLQSLSGQTASSAPIQCDRPRHLIQADRSVVNHILQSQQNFVIARVPIRKFTRPVAAAAAISEQYGYQQQQQNNNVGQHIYQILPPPASAAGPQTSSGGFEGPNGQQQFALSPSSYAFATNQAPVFQDSTPPSTTSIEVSIPRHSIWSSLANLVSSFRGHNHHHSAHVVRPTSLSEALAASELATASNAGGLVSSSASVPAAVFVDGPLILAAAKRRQSYLERLDRRRRRNSRQLRGRWQTASPSNGDGEASLSEAQRRLLVVHSGELLASNNVFAAAAQVPTSAPPVIDHANYAASIIRSQFSNPIMSSASGGHNLDPMRRLLMLKTATDNEVCSPISRVGTKIKYSCVPNYCVALALANNSQASAGQSAEQSMQIFGQQPIYVANNNNYGSMTMSYDGGYRSPMAQSSMSVQRNRSVDPSEHLQVQQFEDLPTTPAKPKQTFHQSQQRQQQPLVTYTHINAYNPPLLSKLVQPSHQQFVSSSQTLDALANDEAIFGSDEFSTELSGQPLDSASYAALNTLNGGSLVANSPPPLVTTSFQAQTSSTPFVGQQQPQLVYMNYDSGGSSYPSGPVVYRQEQASASYIGQPLNRQQPLQPTERPSVTFGSAYITTSPVSFYEQQPRPHLSTNQMLPATSATASFNKQAGGGSKSLGSRNGGRATRTQQDQSEEQENFGPNSLTASLEPNEFLSAVDEKLEKPLSGGGRRKSQLQKQRQQQHRGEWRNRQKPTISTNLTVEKARSTAEQSSANSIDGAPRVQHQTKSPPRHHGEQSALELANQTGAESGNSSKSDNEARYVNSGESGDRDHRLPPAQSPNEVASSAAGGGDGAEGGNDDYETATLDYDQSDYEPEVPTSQQQPLLKPRGRPLQPAAAPAVDMASRQLAETKKTRRDKAAASPITPTTSTTTSGPIRFGQRQSTPLPPPEKNVGADINEDLTQPAGSMDEELYEPKIGDGDASSNITECDCAKPAGFGSSGQGEFHHDHIGHPLDQLSNDRRRASTLAPATLLQRAQPLKTTTATVSRLNLYRQTAGGSSGLLAPTPIGLAKDRRQVASGDGGSSIGTPSSSAWRLNNNTKRPYNLRNTTYKNLLLGGSAINNNNNRHMLLANNAPQSTVGTLLSQRHRHPTVAYIVNSALAQVGWPDQHSNADLSTTRAAAVSLLSENDNQIWPQPNYTSGTATASGTVGSESNVPSAATGGEDGNQYNQQQTTHFDDSVASGAEPLTRHYTNGHTIAPEVRNSVLFVSPLIGGSQPISPQSAAGRGELNNEEDKLGARVRQQQPQQAPFSVAVGYAPTLLPATTGGSADLASITTTKQPQSWRRTATHRTSRPPTLTATTVANTIPSPQPPLTSSAPGTERQSSGSPLAATFTPSSVNDIVAQVRREQSLRAQSASGTNSLASVAPTGTPDIRGSQGASAAANQQQPMSVQNSVDGGEDGGADGDGEDDDEDEGEDDKDVIPHQYQIQVRWHNTSSVDGAGGDAADKLASFASSAPLGARSAKSLKSGGDIELDLMKERVRDNLFEHREEEHWHEKSRLKGRGKRRRLVSGKWILEPLPSKKIASGLNYGPHAHERETPIKGQLANEPSDEQTKRHFAIPTANFRQSPKFVDWILRDVNMNEEPGEPTKIESSGNNDAIAASSMVTPTTLALRRTSNAESEPGSGKIPATTTEATIAQEAASSPLLPSLTTEVEATTTATTIRLAATAS